MKKHGLQEINGKNIGKRNLASKAISTFKSSRLNYHHANTQAKRRVFGVLEALDSNRPLKLDHYWKKIEQRSGAMPKGQRWFLMSKVFELTPSQIAEIEGLTNADSVSISINRVSDQLRAGELQLFPVLELEAKVRLDAVRERRRKH